MPPTSDTTDPKSDRLDHLKAKRAAIEAQIHRLNSAAAAEKRKLDTRRKILLGAVILEEAQRNPKAADWVRMLLKRGLKQPRDRAVFDLPPLTASEVETKADQAATLADTEKSV